MVTLGVIRIHMCYHSYYTQLQTHDTWLFHAGEILCTIHRKVLEEHQRELQPGSVLVLRQVVDLCIRLMNSLAKNYNEV